MNKRVVVYHRKYASQAGTDQELIGNLIKVVDDRGDILAGTYIDDGLLTGKGKNVGWRALLADLDDIDQIVLSDPGDLPGRTVGDLLGVLATLTAHGVSLSLPSQDIDTSTGTVAILDLLRRYRASKLSQAIRAGQQKARQQGRHIGRPAVPELVRRRIAADLARGAETRPTARRYNVSPATVVNIRQTVAATIQVVA